jgi:predicted phage terminase large subunit-like protein
MSSEVINITGQTGPQTLFLSTEADIALYGGAAGGGKSFALIIEPLRHCAGEYANPKFSGIIFRRNTTHVRNPGGLWDESSAVYPLLGATPKEIKMEWKFPCKAQMQFAHLEHEKTVLDYQGAQIPYIAFDELTHFTEHQFFYMLSRNRSTCGIKPYVRASTNPDAESWVRKLIDFWIGEDGLPIKERAGVIRWFIRIENEIVWADTREELVNRNAECAVCKSRECIGSIKEGHTPSVYIPTSFTFIPAKLSDNAILMQKDPGYLAKLMAQDRVERSRLLDGNWNTKATAGNVFRREWFRIVDAANANQTQVIRYWDRAATVPSETNRDPDYTVGTKMARLHTGAVVVLDVVRLRGTPLEVESAILNTASQDGYTCAIGLEQDPGSAGVAEVEHLSRLLIGYDVRIRKPTKDKLSRAKPFSAFCEAGNVYLVKAKWNDAFMQEHENFPPETSGHDDQVDASSGAFNEIAQGGSILDVL